MINWQNPSTLYRAIAETGMTLQQFAKFSGVSRAHLWRIRNGKLGKFGVGHLIQLKIEQAIAKAKRHNATICNGKQEFRDTAPKDIAQ